MWISFLSPRLYTVLELTSCPPARVQSALHSWVIITTSKQTAALEGGTDHPALVSTPQSSERTRWKDVCRREAIRISELLEMMRQKWGADHFPVIIIQPATIAVSIETSVSLPSVARPKATGSQLMPIIGISISEQAPLSEHRLILAGRGRVQCEPHLNRIETAALREQRIRDVDRVAG